MTDPTQLDPSVEAFIARPEKARHEARLGDPTSTVGHSIDADAAQYAMASEYADLERAWRLSENVVRISGLDVAAFLPRPIAWRQTSPTPSTPSSRGMRRRRSRRTSGCGISSVDGGGSAVLSGTAKGSPS